MTVYHEDTAGRRPVLACTEVDARREHPGHMWRPADAENWHWCEGIDDIIPGRFVRSDLTEMIMGTEQQTMRITPLDAEGAPAGPGVTRPIRGFSSHSIIIDDPIAESVWENSFYWQRNPRPLVGEINFDMNIHDRELFETLFEPNDDDIPCVPPACPPVEEHEIRAITHFRQVSGCCRAGIRIDIRGLDGVTWSTGRCESCGHILWTFADAGRLDLGIVGEEGPE